jgi:hypothetical protein
MARHQLGADLKHGVLGDELDELLLRLDLALAKWPRIGWAFFTLALP